MEKRRQNKTREIQPNFFSETRDLRPSLFFPEPRNGEGFKLPLPPSVSFINTVYFNSGGGAAGAPPAGGGSGNRGLELLAGEDLSRRESQCTICNFQKRVSVLISSGHRLHNHRCPMCLGAGTLGALRGLTDTEVDEASGLFSAIAINIHTPLILQHGKLLSVFVKQLLPEEDGYVDVDNGSHSFLLAAVSNRQDRAKLDLGLSLDFKIVAETPLATTEVKNAGDIFLSIRGLKTGYESLTVEPVVRPDMLKLYSFNQRSVFQRFRSLVRTISTKANEASSKKHSRSGH